MNPGTSGASFTRMPMHGVGHCGFPRTLASLIACWAAASAARLRSPSIASCRPSAGFPGALAPWSARWEAAFATRLLSPCIASCRSTFLPAAAGGTFLFIARRACSRRCCCAPAGPAHTGLPGAPSTD